MSEQRPFLGIAVLAVVVAMFGLGLTGSFVYGSLTDVESGRVVMSAATNFPTTAANNAPTTTLTEVTNDATLSNDATESDSVNNSTAEPTNSVTSGSGNVSCPGNDGCSGESAALVGQVTPAKAVPRRRG